ncbi:MAG: threonine/serine exporter family protein [Clostridia bacterium]|nr:threonine/serine exporter family protein [Clostridia bacterium]MDD4048241.1 threonine/serine exporter family protein [Clostridia bacterium]
MEVNPTISTSTNLNLNANKILKVVKLIAQIILENGGETYRVEDTIERVCKKFGFTEVDSVAIPTGVFIAISKDNIDNYTIIKRVKKRTIDLTKVNSANNISRLITENNITLDEAILQLQEMTTPHIKKKVFPTLASALSAGFFTLLFGGNIFDFFVAILCGALVQLTAFLFSDEDMFCFIISLVGSIIIASIALIFTELFSMGNLDLIITGAIMPLLPGLAMTNAIHDTMRGDLVSGVARGTEALIVAIALAVGVGIVLKIWMLMGGGLALL